MKITFKKSNKTLEWNSDYTTLLEFAEDHGLDLDFGCREGRCTACEVPLLEGQVDYPNGHTADIEAGNILTCCSVPKQTIVIDA